MKYIPIVPTKYLEDAGEMTLCLAHKVLIDEDYVNSCKIYQDNGGLIIMDNSYYELRRNLTDAEMIKVCNRIRPYAFVLPDLKWNPAVTLELRRIISVLRKSGYKDKFWGVVTVCENFNEELHLFEALNNIDEIDVIALPYSFRKEDEFSRDVFLNMVEQRIGKENIKPVHLFGLNSLEKLKVENRDYVISVDGTLAWKCGYYLKRLPISVEDDPSRPDNYFEIDSLTPYQRELINFNMLWMKDLDKYVKEGGK